MSDVCVSRAQGSSKNAEESQCAHAPFLCADDKLHLPHQHTLKVHTRYIGLGKTRAFHVSWCLLDTRGRNHCSAVSCDIGHRPDCPERTEADFIVVLFLHALVVPCTLFHAGPPRAGRQCCPPSQVPVSLAWRRHVKGMTRDLCIDKKRPSAMAGEMDGAMRHTAYIIRCMYRLTHMALVAVREYK